MNKICYMIAAFILAVCTLSGCSSQTVAPTQVPTEALPIDPYERGVNHLYKVGEDIEAGKYLAYTTDGKIAGYCIASDPACEDIISNGHFEGRSYIEVNDGEYLDTSFCEIKPFSEVEPYQAPNGIIADGQYLVGFDIEPGTYRLVGTGLGGTGRYTISADANGDILVDKNVFTDSIYIKVHNTEYLQLENCVLE